MDISLLDFSSSSASLLQFFIFFYLHYTQINSITYAEKKLSINPETDVGAIDTLQAESWV